MKPPVDVIELFPKLNDKLISFLRSLSSADWQTQTVAKKWVVKDVAAHLLDVNLRRIAIHRDGWTESAASPVDSYSDLINYLNALNADWVKASKRLSPAIITDMLESTNEEVYRLFKNLDPYAPSFYAVSWADEKESQNWLDIAREYTERWLHQQQIRDALNNKEIMTKELYHPFLDISMYAWPVACKYLMAAEGTVIKATIRGEGGGQWYLIRKEANWNLQRANEYDSSKNGNTISAETVIDGNEAWKLFSKSKRKKDMSDSYEIKGDQRYGEKMLDMVAFMA